MKTKPTDFSDVESVTRLIMDELLTPTEKCENQSYRIKSNDDGLSIEIDLPGTDPKTVNVYSIANKLIVEYNKGEKKLTQKFVTKPEFDLKAASASYSFGQLTVKVPSAFSQVTTRIPVKIQ